MNENEYITVEETGRLINALSKYGLLNIRSIGVIKSRCNEVLKLLNPFLKGPNAGDIEGLKRALHNYFFTVFSVEAENQIAFIGSWKYTNPEIYKITVDNIRKNVEWRCKNVLYSIFGVDNKTVVEIAKDMLNDEKYINSNIGKVLWLTDIKGTEQIAEPTSRDEKDYDFKTV